MFPGVEGSMGFESCLLPEILQAMLGDSECMEAGLYPHN